MKKARYNWLGIRWASEQDVVVQRRVRLEQGGEAVLRRGREIHPTRERVRQKRLAIYLARLRSALRLPEREGEGEVRAGIELALRQKGARQMATLRKVGELELALESSLRLALVKANAIYRPKGWHSREGTTKEVIRRINTKDKTVKEIAALAGCGVSYVSQALKDLKKTCKAAHRGKELYNWRRFFPYDRYGRVVKKGAGRWQDHIDKEIARSLRIPNPMVVTQYRNRNKFKRRERAVERVAA